MKFLATIISVLIFGIILVYISMPGPRAWPRGAWDAADRNRDGKLTREEMTTFGKQQSHRNSPRLLWHFDNADTNGDQIVDAAEVEAYGTNVGSKDPEDHLPSPSVSR